MLVLPDFKTIYINADQFFLNVNLDGYDTDRATTVFVSEMDHEVALFVLGVKMYEDVLKYTVNPVTGDGFKMVQSLRVDFKNVKLLKGSIPSKLLNEPCLYNYYYHLLPEVKFNYQFYLDTGLLFDEGVDVGLIIGETIKDLIVAVRKKQ